MQKKQQPREKNSPHRVDVLQRIEGDPAAAQSGVVAEAKRDKAVSRLVERNRDNRGKRPDRDRVKQRAKLLIHLTPLRISLWRLEMSAPGGGTGRGMRLFLGGLFRLAGLFAPICF